MTGTLRLVTFSDRPLGGRNALAASARDHGVPLEVVVRPGPWTANALKLGLLHRFLRATDAADGDLLFVVDALDVAIEAPPGRLVRGFEAFGADVVFAAEAGFYFADRGLEPHYRAHHPPGDGPYRYLNSGTFAGRVGALRALLQGLCARYELDPTDERQLRRLRSDQLLFARSYVDLLHGAPGPRVVLDHRQALFACAGGRMFVSSPPASPGPEDFVRFRAARRALRHARLLAFQDTCADLAVEDGVLRNRLTGTTPGLLHLPGTHQHFGRALARLRGAPADDGLLRRLAERVERAGLRAAERELARDPHRRAVLPSRWSLQRFRPPPAAPCPVCDRPPGVSPSPA